jgi:peptidoglycan/xylan/chitin deacetylase (PgdA/CDA1 family)
MGHGHPQGPMHRLDDQEGAIVQALDAIEEFRGSRPRGWESPGLTETEETLDLLRKHGVEYVADRVIDDLPEVIQTPHGTVTTIPYTVEMNDITVHALQGHESNVFLKRGRDQFDRLYAEGAQNARVMAISIHPCITGVPHRIGHLEALLDCIGGHEGVACMTASEIGDWYGAQMTRIGKGDT